MGYIRGFVPWIASGVVSAVADWRWGAVAGFVTGVLLLVQDRRRGVALDALVLEASSIVYFAVIGTYAFLSPDSAVAEYNGTLSFVWLAGTAWLGLAVQRPFTLGIARRQAPEEYWSHPGFIAVNKVITAVWAGGFTFIFVALTVCELTDASGWLQGLAHAVGLVVPAVVTKVYPARIQARVAALGAQAG
ncbi:hypothetical protein AB0O01_01655 [Streptomyces sp. NPDC093252]|uniref:hypothetical protein n=1 Tax=Streptomyces sp. NPDC093252 TaxID=3154980 RepID=UPI003427CE23